MICAILTILFVQDRPSGESQTIKNESISFWKACKLPGVASFSIAYGCIKLLNYSLMMWLPYYLSNYVKASIGEMAIIISAFDIGGFLGSMIAGYISDHTTSREPVLITMMVMSIPVIFCFIFGSPGNVWIYYVLVPICGAFIVACSNLLSTCVATDLAHHTESNEHTHAMATVAGIVDGTGSLGAASGQIVIGALSKISWNYVFFGMILVGVVSILVISIAKFESEGKKNEMKESLLINR
jgi:OPA family glycerol-3-phosphate transporter-like MFS transporter 3